MARSSPNTHAHLPCGICGTNVTELSTRSRYRKRGYGYCSPPCHGEAKRRAAAARRTTRFLSRVKKGDPDECWPYQGYRSARGYGFVTEGAAKNTPAHRYMYRLVFGEVPDNKVVCHKCDNPPCCNPNHLWLGSNAENIQDMWRKGRGKQARPLKGEAHMSAKLTEDDVREIRASSDPRPKLATRYGVSWGAIDCIQKRKTWKHVQ